VRGDCAVLCGGGHQMLGRTTGVERELSGSEHSLALAPTRGGGGGRASRNLSSLLRVRAKLEKSFQETRGKDQGLKQPNRMLRSGKGIDDAAKRRWKKGLLDRPAEDMSVSSWRTNGKMDRHYIAIHCRGLVRRQNETLSPGGG